MSVWEKRCRRLCLGALYLLKTEACLAALGSSADSADPIIQQSSRTEKPVDSMGHVFPSTPIPWRQGLRCICEFMLLPSFLWGNRGSGFLERKDHGRHVLQPNHVSGADSNGWRIPLAQKWLCFKSKHLPAVFT